MHLDTDDFSNPQLIKVGFALLHFLWQGILMAAVTLAGFRFLKQAPSNSRYLFALAMFGVLALLPPVTFLLVEGPEIVATQTPLPRQAVTSDIAIPADNIQSQHDEAVQVVAFETLSSNAEPVRSESAGRLGFAISNSQQMLSVLALVWASGVSLLSLRLVFGWIMMLRVRRLGLSAVPTHVQAMCNALCMVVPVRKVVRVFESTIVQVPAVVGWLRPLILVPANLLTGLSDAELRAILAHELAHLRRHDYLINLGQIVIENLLFYHPVVWWLSSRIRHERENCCDDIAADVCGSKVLIARALTTLAELNARTSTMLPAATGGSLVQRIRRLLQADAKPERVSSGGIGFGILCLILPLAVALWPAVFASDPAKAEEPSTSTSVAADKDSEEVTTATQDKESAPPQVPKPSPDANKAPAPFEELHRIPEGRVLHRVPLPITPEAKKRYESVTSPEQIAAMPDGPGGRIWRYDGKTIRLGMSSYGGGDGMNLHSLVEHLAGITMCELEGSPTLWLKGTKSDFVVRDGATPEQIIADLDQILNEELNYNATLKFEDVERDVFLVKGRFVGKPAGPEMRFQLKPRPTYLLFGETRAKELYEMHEMGKYPKFWKAVSLRVGRPIVDESENAPDDYLQWLLSFDNPETTVWDTIPPRQFSANSELVLNRISEQTGLTFEKATRTVRVLSLKPKAAAQVIPAKPQVVVQKRPQPAPLTKAAQEAENQAQMRRVLMRIQGKQIAADEREADEQAEQRELSKDWALKFPPDVKENELAGVIVDVNGQPLAGVKVDLFPAFTGHETTTDDQGVFRYTFDRASKGDTVEVRFSKDGYSPIYRRKQLLGAADLRVILNNSTYLEGKVVDKNDKPVPDATVVAAHPYIWTGEYPSFDRETKTATDALGHYRLYLNPEIYSVSVISERDGVERVPGIEVVKDEAQTLDVKLNDGVNFRAQVLDAESKEPIAGFTLYHRTNAVARGVSNAEGMIEIPNALSGDEVFQVGSGTPTMGRGYYSCSTDPFGNWWSPEAKKPWHRTSTTETGIMFELSPGMDPVTIYVRPAVVISGKVTDPDGNPVAQATVAPARTGTGNSLTGDTRYSVETKDDGTYVMNLPPSGNAKYNLLAHDGKYAQWRKFASGVTEPFSTKPGERLDDVNIQLHRPATVRGRVISEDGRSLAGLQVRAHAVDKRGNRYYDPTTKTNEDGTFEVSHIRPGEHFIQLEPFSLNAEDLPAERSVVVDLTEGETKDGIEFPLSDK